MMNRTGAYRRIPFPPSRNLVMDIVGLGTRKHHLPVMIELDVTKALDLLGSLKAETGESLSFTGWMAKCIAQAVGEHPQMHALRWHRRSMIIFDDIDVLVTVNKIINGQEIALPYVVRQANEKSVRQISDEIRSAQSQQMAGGDMAIGQSPWFAVIYPRLPTFMRHAFGRVLMNNPFSVKRSSGTVGISAVGMIANFSGWVFPVSPQPLMFGLAGITRKPGVIGDRILVREYLSVCFLFDHDVVDGAPVARFTSRLAELAEQAFGLYQPERPPT
jgi:pyruvate/2-oxoglutarate dehydrogenase complex dihydrolipoamide acyltransferase (E2) component